MRWTVPIGTVAGLAVLTGILWNTQGRSLLEKLPLVQKEKVTSQRIDIDTLVKMSDPQLMDEIAQTSRNDTDNPSPATQTTEHSRAFVGGNADDTELALAISQWEQRLAANVSAGSTKPRFAGRTASQTNYGSMQTNSIGYGFNSSVNDYKYIPRMQRFGLTRSNRYGRVYAFGKRSLWNRSRFGQQQREMQRLRGLYDQRNRGGQVVSRSRR